MVPTEAEIRALHERFAPHRAALDLVWTHCEIVARLAGQVVERVRGQGLAIDEVLVRAGCLLHDIGVYRLYGADGELDHGAYVRHGVLGYELLREAGLPPAICRFCSCHTGVGLTSRDVVEQGLPLPVRDYLATSLEEEVVMYADTFHSKTSPPVFVTAHTYAAQLERFGADKVATFAGMVSRFGEPDLGELSRAYGFGIV